MRIATALLTLAIALTSGAAFAQSGGTSSTPRIDQRQANQEARIEQGEKSGSLNAKEARRLEKGQQRVQNKENRAVADGKVTAKERRRIERAQDKQSKKIYGEKHDKQVQK